MNIVDEEIQVVPIWMKLPKLNVKYWGEKCLIKLVNHIGKPVKLDQATQKKERIMFARIMVEVNVNQQLPETLVFVNEDGKEVMRQDIQYEWRPTVCQNCKKMGHMTQEYRNKKRMEWRPRAVPNTPQPRPNVPIPHAPQPRPE